MLTTQEIDARLRDGKLVIDEVEEVIALPRYDAEAAKAQDKAKKPAQVSQKVVEQLHEYISLIGKSYRNNPFHVRTLLCSVGSRCLKAMNGSILMDLLPTYFSYF